MEENFSQLDVTYQNNGLAYKDKPAPINERFCFEKLSSFLIRFLNVLKKTGKSINTINAYRNDLTLFSEFLIEKQIKPDTYSEPVQEHWLSFLKKNGRRSQASLRRAQMSVRSFVHFLVSEEIIEKSIFLESRSPKQPTAKLATVSQDKFQELYKILKSKALQGDSKAVRDLALVLILGECGLKASEVANLCWGDVWPEVEQNTMTTVGCLRIRNESQRLVPYSREVSESLEMLRQTRKMLELPTELESKLFFGYLNVSRRTRTDFLHRHGIKFVIYEICSEILGVPYNSESLRNHAILKWLSQGIDKENVAKLAGYSSLNSLERFLKYPGIKKLNRKRKLVQN